MRQSLPRALAVLLGAFGVFVVLEYMSIFSRSGQHSRWNAATCSNIPVRGSAKVIEVPHSCNIRSLSNQQGHSNMGVFNVLSATVLELQKLLETRQISTVEIIQTYLSQIDKHNLHGMKLRALITVASNENLLEQARKLDEERSAKGPRGPLHGIPIIVKVRTPLS